MKSFAGFTSFLVAVLALGSVASAQGADERNSEAPVFEAVSIHLVSQNSAGGAEGAVSSFPTNLFYVRGAPLAFLVQLAYRVDSQDRVTGMPGWMESQEYAISAKVEGDRQLTLEQIRPMLQRLLAERFHFAAHPETKMVSGFDLVLAKGGTKLQKSVGSAEPWAMVVPNRIAGGHMPLAQIAGALAHHVGRPVVDRTGLSGTYDFAMSFAAVNDANSAMPNFFRAVQDDLGLKLQPDKVPETFLVVDHADRVPTEN